MVSWCNSCISVHISELMSRGILSEELRRDIDTNPMLVLSISTLPSSTLIVSALPAESVGRNALVLTKMYQF